MTERPIEQPRGPGGAWIDPTAFVSSEAVCHAGAWIGPDVHVEAGCTISPGAVVGYPGPGGFAKRVTIGPGCWIGPHVHIEPGVRIGPNCTIESGCVVRSGTRLANGVRLGVRCTLIGPCSVAAYCSLEGEVHVGAFSTLEENCQLMPGAILLNDAYPPTALDPAGPTVGACAIVGVKAVIYPRVVLGYHALVAALSVVHHDVGDYTLVSGSPAKAICDVRRIRCKVQGRWLYPYPWMRNRVAGEDLTRPAL